MNKQNNHEKTLIQLGSDKKSKKNQKNIQNQTLEKIEDQQSFEEPLTQAIAQENELKKEIIENERGEKGQTSNSNKDASNEKNLLSKKKPKPLFKCEVCGKIFKAKNSLKDHVRIHEGIKPYHCSWPSCGKKFTQQSSLQKHYRIHKGEKPYICHFENCTLAFTQISNLKRHIRIHTKEKPFQCRISDCQKSFNTTSNRKQHEQIHKNFEERLKFQCKICLKVYYYTSNLKKHTNHHIKQGEIIPESQMQLLKAAENDQNIIEQCWNPLQHQQPDQNSSQTQQQEAKNNTQNQDQQNHNVKIEDDDHNNEKTFQFLKTIIKSERETQIINNNLNQNLIQNDLQNQQNQFQMQIEKNDDGKQNTKSTEKQQSNKQNIQIVNKQLQYHQECTQEKQIQSVDQKYNQQQQQQQQEKETNNNYQPQVKIEDLQVNSKSFKKVSQIFTIQKFENRAQYLQYKQNQQNEDKLQLEDNQKIENFLKNNPIKKIKKQESIQKSITEFQQPGYFIQQQLANEDPRKNINEIQQQPLSLLQAQPVASTDPANLIAYAINQQVFQNIQQQQYYQQIVNFFSNQQLIIHNGHIDYLINGYLYFFDGSDINIHELEASDINPDDCKKLEEISHVPNQKSLELIFKKIQESNSIKFCQNDINIQQQQQQQQQIGIIGGVGGGCAIIALPQVMPFNIIQPTTIDNQMINESQNQLQQSQYSQKSETQQVLTQTSKSNNGSNNIFIIEKCAHAITNTKSEKSRKNSSQDLENQQIFLDQQISKIYQSKTNQNKAPTQNTNIKNTNININNNQSITKSPINNNVNYKKFNHIHSDECGHQIIYHNGHKDYIVGDTLHHPHYGHCDDHGKIQFFKQIL